MVTWKKLLFYFTCLFKFTFLVFKCTFLNDVKMIIVFKGFDSFPRRNGKVWESYVGIKKQINKNCVL